MAPPEPGALPNALSSEPSASKVDILRYSKQAGASNTIIGLLKAADRHALPPPRRPSAPPSPPRLLPPRSIRAVFKARAGRAAHSRRTLRVGSREPAKKRLFIADSRSPPPRRDGDNKVSVSEERSRPAPAPAVSSPIRLARDQRSLPGRSQRWFGQRSPPCVPLHS